MKSAIKWIGIAAAVLVGLVIIILAAAYIYVPDLHKQWVKPGIAQRKIPAGVDTSVVIANVSVIPMDSERVMEGQTVTIEDGRIANIRPGRGIRYPSRCANC